MYLFGYKNFCDFTKKITPLTPEVKDYFLQMDVWVACMTLPVPGAAETKTEVTPDTVSVFVLRNLEL